MIQEMQFSSLEKKILVVLVILAIALGGWFYYQKLQHPGSYTTSYHKSYPPVTNVRNIPLALPIRFLIMGDKPTILDGRHEERAGETYDEVIYTTPTSRAKTYDQYIEYFEGMHWTIDNKVKADAFDTIVAHKSPRSATIMIETKNGTTKVRAGLIIQGASKSPSPSPSPTPKK
jgi:hypothetical protein